MRAELRRKRLGFLKAAAEDERFPEVIREAAKSEISSAQQRLMAAAEKRARKNLKRTGRR